MTDLVKAQGVVGKEITAIKIEDREIWLDFRDGGRMVFQIKYQGDMNTFTEELRVLVDSEIVHQFKIIEIDHRKYH